MLNELNLEDVLLCDPISKRGREALKRIRSAIPSVTMTFNDFYSKKLYVEPQFFNTADSTSNTTNPVKINPEFTDIGTQKRNITSKKKNFEKLFFSDTTKPLLSIRAASGSGKSVYLNYLRYMRRKNNNTLDCDDNQKNGLFNSAREINFDLEYSKSKIQKGSITFPSTQYPIHSIKDASTATWQFFTMLLESAYENIFEVIKTENQTRFDNIEKNFKYLYQENYNDETENVFTLIKKADVSNKRETGTLLLDSLIKYSLKNADNIFDCIKNILKLLTRFLVCDSKIENPCQILISFDNIEHYIEREKRIFDSDIFVITNSVYKFIEDEEIYYEDINLNFASFFKIILVIRDTTNNMLSRRASIQHYFSQYVESSIDVTNWFSPTDIYNEKLKYFQQYIPQDLITVKFLNLIIQDSGTTYKTSFTDLLSSMYNHNKRRTTRILANISNLFEELVKENAGATMDYEKFENVFINAIKYNRDNQGEIRYLCRHALLRLVYNEICTTGYFDRICSHESFPSCKTSYARRILTLIANTKNYDTEEYMSFYDIVNSLLGCPDIQNAQIDEKELHKIAEILIALNEYEYSSADGGTYYHSTNGPNKWCQLVIIKFNETTSLGELDISTLSTKMLEEYKNRSTDTSDFGVRITEAGYYFVSKLCDYEYLSCRCKKNNIPLLFICDKKLVLDTIKNIYSKTSEYIKSIVLQEYVLFKGNYDLANEYKYNLYSTQNNTGLPLPIRLILNHTNYLLKYKNYILNDQVHQSIEVFNEDDRKEICKQIDFYINEYKKIAKQLMESTYEINYRNETIKIANYLSDETKKVIETSV